MGAPKGHPNYASPDNLGGRPVKYTDEFIENEADELEKWMQNPENIFLKRFAFERGYDYDLMTEWSKINKRFFRAYKRLHDWQEIKLGEGGLTKAFDSNFSKFLLIANCGYSDKGNSENEETNAFVEGMRAGMGKSANMMKSD